MSHSLSLQKLRAMVRCRNPPCPKRFVRPAGIAQPDSAMVEASVSASAAGTNRKPRPMRRNPGQKRYARAAGSAHADLAVVNASVSASAAGMNRKPHAKRWTLCQKRHPQAAGSAQAHLVVVEASVPASAAGMKRKPQERSVNPSQEPESPGKEGNLGAQTDPAMVEASGAVKKRNGSSSRKNEAKRPRLESAASVAKAKDPGADDVRMKVTILREKSTGRVLFIEAGKELVDMLFSFLVLPVGTVLSKLAAHGFHLVRGGLANVHQSVQWLDDSSFSVPRTHLLNPAVSGISGHVGEASLPPASNGSQSGKTGFVMKNATFIVTDALEVFPSSVAYTIDLLRSLHVSSMLDVASEEVKVGVREVRDFRVKSMLNFIEAFPHQSAA